MKLSFNHSGIIVQEKRAGMRYIEPNRLWVSDPADSPDGIEYLYYFGPVPDTPERDIMYALKDEALIEFCCDK